MANEAATIVQRLWNYCSVLRDDGVSYGDYVEQLTFLLFLKMADETKQLKHVSPIPEGIDWQALCKPDGDALEVQYRHTLSELGKMSGALGIIFKKAQNRIQDPAKLKRLIELINGETWLGMDIDIKGEIYEGLLQKNAEDVKGGAGQYFTPRSLIKAIVEVMNPKPLQTIHDPACGTGGFFLAAHDYLSHQYQMDRDQKTFLKLETFSGCDIVDNVGRLCVMNLFLHGVGGEDSLIEVRDSLLSEPKTYYDIVMTNPPFGKKSSITIVNEEGKADRETITYKRQDFSATTSNKQLNFLQHVRTLLKVTGRAAIVVPDNVLFEGGAGETIRRKLLKACDVHTLLRLPTGIFYAQGVKANVLFMDNKPASETPWTKKLWIYDLRTNQHFTLKTNQMSLDSLQDFVKCYNPANRHERTETERYHSFTYEELIQRDKASLDIFWLKDDSIEDSANLPDPDVLALDIAENLEAALEQFRGIVDELNQ